MRYIIDTLPHLFSTTTLGKCTSTTVSSTVQYFAMTHRIKNQSSRIIAFFSDSLGCVRLSGNPEKSSPRICTTSYFSTQFQNSSSLAPSNSSGACAGVSKFSSVQQATSTQHQHHQQHTMKDVGEDIVFRTVTSKDIARCHDLESSSYPEDEAASMQSLIYRQQNAAEYFYCAWSSEHQVMVGFICATRCNVFTHDSLYTHISNGNILAIHSVVVDASYRRKGLGTRMMQAYQNHFMTKQNNDGMHKIMLISKANLLTFYLSTGFRVNGISTIQHGKDIWYECEFNLRSKNCPCTVNLNGMPYSVVDSFTQTFGCGNPAAVVLVPDELTDEAWRKTVAREFNLSETAFVWKDATTNKNHYHIRYYTRSGVEVDLCGHATLASAATIFQRQEEEEEPSDSCSLLTFQTKNPHVTLTVSKHNDTNSTSSMKYIMDFPWKTICNYNHNGDNNTSWCDKMLRDTLGITNSSDILFVGVGSDGEDLFVEISTSAFHGLPAGKDINYGPMVALSGYSRGVIVCCRSDEPGIDFFSRFWGPKVGILEDPVTGSAHCLLGPYFYSVFQKKKNHLIGKQMSSRRGLVECIMIDTDDPDKRKVRIAGSAVITMKGALQV